MKDDVHDVHVNDIDVDDNIDRVDDVDVDDDVDDDNVNGVDDVGDKNDEVDNVDVDNVDVDDENVSEMMRRRSRRSYENDFCRWPVGKKPFAGAFRNNMFPTGSETSRSCSLAFRSIWSTRQFALHQVNTDMASCCSICMSLKSS